MKKLYLLLFLFVMVGPILAQLQSPDEFLPHKLGAHFTPHHLLVDYYEHVADQSPLVKLVPYGFSNQDRPMMVAIVTSEANHERLEDIRLNNLRIAGIEDGAVEPALSKALVWLSFSVHGNEAAGSEAAHQVIYDLVNPDNARTKAWLDNTVIILDPSVNPDGYSRYTHWVRNVTSDDINMDIQDIEHMEPWPGGRVNHYLFDLNRDWAWQTQLESRQRMELYNNWLPHVHADLHEMGHESPYYFAPAARPYHPYITKWQRDFQTDIGKNHAKYFNQEGWLYFTKEVFDLFYPSYGDTYPTYSGAIGMTYEQGGSRVGGRAVKLKNNEVLTLKDRIDHHVTTALSTIEITSVNDERVISEFQDFYDMSSNNPPGKYKSFVIKKDKSGRRLLALANLLERQGIQYGTVSANSKISGYVYSQADQGSLQAEVGDMVVSAYQPKGLLTQILLEPSAALEDSVTYDITAWSLPYAYGLDAVASTSRIDPSPLDMSFDTGELTKSYAFLIPRTDLESVKYISKLIEKEISVRIIPKTFTYKGVTCEAGTAVVTRADNRSKDDELMSIMLEAKKVSPLAQVIPIDGGFAEEGHDLGSGKVYLVEQPKILTLSGEGVSTNGHGQIKWYFDRAIDYPLSVVDVANWGRIDLDKYNTLILPEGWYSISQGMRERISSWVDAGGKLIAIGSATTKLMDQKGFGLKRYATDGEKSTAEKENKEADLAARYNHYSESERRSISDYVPGAIFGLTVDPTHPLGYGMGDTYYSLRTSSTTFPLQVDAANVIVHPKDGEKVVGFAGAKIRQRLQDSAAFVVEDKGRGTVIYMADNPLYRGFWYNGLFLFSNAVFVVQ